MAAGSINMASRKQPARGSSGAGENRASGEKEVPIQVMVPETVRRQVALMGADRGENIRTVVLRGLRAIGIDIPESELADRRGRRRNGKGGSDGAQ
ncbi:hypothetical protein [Mesorhizobium sp. J18]|uniref:hypothetical protein n=1 Tax=Mesorhizobium sp. J18 TaxID=935263 RepID=UPI00119EECB5|nr:hypothetical protein [Mesorhizobium sp. J18]